MIANKEVKPLENSSVELTVTVAKEDAQKEYDELVTKYSKTLAVRGFRKGKVPVNVLVQKYGDSLLSEASANIIENGLKEALDGVEKQPLAYAIPQLQGEPNLELGKDFSFTVTYDTFPEITVGTYKELEIEEPDVAVAAEDEERELEGLRDQNATIVPKEEGAVEEGDIVTVDYGELDEKGEETAGTHRQDFVFTVGSGYNLYKLDDDIIGMKNGEEKVVEKEYGDDYEYEELRGKKVSVKVKVTAIKQKKLPELDDDLAQDISEKYQTLQDLKDDIRKRLQEDLDARVRQVKIDALMDKIIEGSTISLPKAMVDAELELTWDNFVSQSRVGERRVLDILASQGKSKENLLEEWTPSSEKNIKTRLIINELAKKEKLDATDEEVDKEIARQAELRDSTPEEVRELFEKNNSMEYLRRDLTDRKVFDLLIENANVKKGQKISYMDLANKNQ